MEMDFISEKSVNEDDHGSKMFVIRLDNDSFG